MASHLASCESQAGPFTRGRKSCHGKSRQRWSRHAESGSRTSQALHWTLRSRLVNLLCRFVKVLSCLVLQRQKKLNNCMCYHQTKKQKGQIRSVHVSEYNFSIRTSCILSELFFQEDRGVLNSNSHHYMLQIFSCVPALCTWREHSNARLLSRFPVRSANFCEKNRAAAMGLNERH